MSQEIEWNKLAINILRSEMTLRGYEIKDLPLLLEKIGVSESEIALKHKFNRGSFKATFFLQILKAIGCDHLSLSILHNLPPTYQAAPDSSTED